MATPLLPRPEPASWRAQAAASQRDRLLAAMADACVAKGYAATTVADVVGRAGVSRRTFYEHFANLEQCVLATYDRGAEVLSAQLAERLEESQQRDPAADWRQRLRDLLAGYLDALAQDAAFTQFAMVEVLAAGPKARERYLEVVAHFHGLLRRLDDMVAARQRRHVPLSDVALSMLGGGLGRLVMTEVLAGRAAELPSHLDELHRFCVQALTNG